MADFSPFFRQPGGLISLRAAAHPWLDRLAGGLSRLGVCRQLLSAPDLWMRLGPDEWWCWWQDEARTADSVMQTIAQAADGQHHACVDISDAQVAFVSRDGAAPVLSFGCDLDFERLPGDFAGRTRLAAFQVVLARQQAPQGAMLLWTESSLAESLQTWLDRSVALARR